MNLWGKDKPFPTKKKIIRIKAASREWSSHFLLDSGQLYMAPKRTASDWHKIHHLHLALASIHQGPNVSLSPGATTKKLSLCSSRLFMHSTCTSCWLQHTQLDFQMGAKPNGATLCSDHRNFHWHLFQCFLHLHRVYNISSYSENSSFTT